MMLGAQAAALLELSAEPQVVALRCSRVVAANAAARALFVADPVGHALCDLTVGSAESLLALLQRCQRNNILLPGALHLADGAGGSRRLAVMARRLPGEQTGPLLIGLHIRARQQDRFEALNRQIKALDAEVTERRRVQLELEQALAYNALLLRELQHRVKNTIQVLSAIMSRSAAGSDNIEFKENMARARARLLAAEKAHSLLHNAPLSGTAHLKELIENVAFALRDSFGSDVETVVEAQESLHVSAQETTPIALIVNELVTNAYKHGAQRGLRRIEIKVEQQGANLRLSVRDDGPGFRGEAPPEGFGLKLVRGLTRQLGGTLTLCGEGGLACEIRAPLRPPL